MQSSTVGMKQERLMSIHLCIT